MDTSLVGFTAAVMVSVYLVTEKKWATAIAGIAGYCSYKYLTTGKIKKVKLQEQPAATAPLIAPAEVVKPKVVAFDFDKCLMTHHWWAKYRNGDINTINPGPEDFAHKNIGHLFTDILARPGVNLAVASFGRGDVIRKAIDSVLEPQLSQKVFITTPGDYPPYSDGTTMGNKNVQLQAVSDKFATPIQDIIFFDDDKRNISSAKDMGINAQWAAPFDESCEHLIYEHLDA